MLSAWAVAAAQTRGPLLVDPQSRATLGVFEGPVALALEPGRLPAGAQPAGTLGLAVVARGGAAIVEAPGAVGWAVVERPAGRFGASCGFAAAGLAARGRVEHAFADVPGGEVDAVDAEVELAAGGPEATGFLAWRRLAGTVDRVADGLRRSGASTRLTPENHQDLLVGGRARRPIGAGTLELSLAVGSRFPGVAEARWDLVGGAPRTDVVATELLAARGAASAWAWWELRQGEAALRLGVEALADGVAGQRWVTTTSEHRASGLGTSAREGAPELAGAASLGFPLGASVPLGAARLEGALVPAFAGLSPTLRGALGLRVRGPTTLSLVLDAPERALVAPAPELSVWLSGAPARRGRAGP